MYGEVSPYQVQRSAADSVDAVIKNNGLNCVNTMELCVGSEVAVIVMCVALAAIGQVVHGFGRKVPA